MGCNTSGIGCPAGGVCSTTPNKSEFLPAATVTYPFPFNPTILNQVYSNLASGGTLPVSNVTSTVLNGATIQLWGNPTQSSQTVAVVRADNCNGCNVLTLSNVTGGCVPGAKANQPLFITSSTPQSNPGPSFFMQVDDVNGDAICQNFSSGACACATSVSPTRAIIDSNGPPNPSTNSCFATALNTSNVSLYLHGLDIYCISGGVGILLWRPGGPGSSTFVGNMTTPPANLNDGALNMACNTTQCGAETGFFKFEIIQFSPAVVQAYIALDPNAASLCCFGCCGAPSLPIGQITQANCNGAGFTTAPGGVPTNNCITFINSFCNTPANMEVTGGECFTAATKGFVNDTVLANYCGSLTTPHPQAQWPDAHMHYWNIEQGPPVWTAQQQNICGCNMPFTEYQQFDAFLHQSIPNYVTLGDVRCLIPSCAASAVKNSVLRATPCQGTQCVQTINLNNTGGSTITGNVSVNQSAACVNTPVPPGPPGPTPGPPSSSSGFPLWAIIVIIVVVVLIVVGLILFFVLRGRRKGTTTKKAKKPPAGTQQQTAATATVTTTGGGGEELPALPPTLFVY